MRWRRTPIVFVVNVLTEAYGNIRGLWLCANEKTNTIIYAVGAKLSGGNVVRSDDEWIQASKRFENIMSPSARIKRAAITALYIPVHLKIPNGYGCMCDVINGPLLDKPPKSANRNNGTSEADDNSNRMRRVWCDRCVAWIKYSLETDHLGGYCGFVFGCLPHIFNGVCSIPTCHISFNQTAHADDRQTNPSTLLRTHRLIHKINGTLSSRESRSLFVCHTHTHKTFRNLSPSSSGARAMQVDCMHCACI